MKSPWILRLPAVCAASVLALGLAAAGCGGGDDDDSSGPGPTVKTGVLVDAPVKGVKWTAVSSGGASRTGTTNADGEFEFVDGDRVTFMIGAVDLGTVAGRETVTPLEIAQAELAEGTPVADVEVKDYATNLARFLQTFDADGNPDNGIDIPTAVVTAADTAVTFEVPLETFGADGSAFAQLAQETGDSIVSIEDAVAHVREEARKLLANTWVLVDKQGNYIPDAVTFFPDGHYLFGGRDDDAECNPDANTNTTYANDPNGNGMEYGRYTWDLLDNGRFLVHDLTVETNGTCGLNGSADDEAADDARLNVDGITLIYSINRRNDEPCDEVSTLNGDRCEFRLVMASELGGFISNSRKGSWLADGLSPDFPAVYIFNGDTSGRYFMIGTDESGDGGDDFKPGIEEGTFSIGANNALTVNPVVDSNGNGGFADNGTPFDTSPRLFVNPDNSRKLVYQDNAPNDPCADLDDCTATRIPLIGVGE